MSISLLQLWMPILLGTFLAWVTTAKYLLDALIYGLVVAGSFAWLWPG